MAIVNCNMSELFFQTHKNASLWMREAVDAIDEQFYDGYAENHPELVGAYMNACSSDWVSSNIALLADAVSGEKYKNA